MIEGKTMSWDATASDEAFRLQDDDMADDDNASELVLGELHLPGLVRDVFPSRSQRWHLRMGRMAGRRHNDLLTSATGSILEQLTAMDEPPRTMDDWMALVHRSATDVATPYMRLDEDSTTSALTKAIDEVAPRASTVVELVDGLMERLPRTVQLSPMQRHLVGQLGEQFTAPGGVEHAVGVRTRIWATVLSAGQVLDREESRPVVVGGIVGMYSSQYWSSSEARHDWTSIATVLSGGDERRARAVSDSLTMSSDTRATAGFLGRLIGGDAGGAVVGCLTGAVGGPAGCGAGAAAWGLRSSIVVGAASIGGELL